MKYLSAYLLLVLGGNATPSAADVSKVLKSVGAEVDEEKLATVLSKLEGKSIDELIAAGEKKLVSLGGAGGGGSSSAGGKAAAGGSKEEEKQEKKEEKAEEIDVGGGNLFGDSGKGY